MTLPTKAWAAIVVGLLSARMTSGQEAAHSDTDSVADEAKPDSPAEANNYDVPPKPLRITKPAYPREAFERHVEGTVQLEIFIDATGHVGETRVLKSVEGLDEAAQRCVAQWQFEPARKGGVAVGTWARAPVGFVAGFLPGPSPRPDPPRHLGAPRFDAKGVDFTSWLDRFRLEVYGAWVVPEIVRRAYAQLEFVVERDGRVSSAKVIDPSGVPAFDEGARNAILAGKLMPLPAAYRGSSIRMRIVFSYAQTGTSMQPGRGGVERRACAEPLELRGGVGVLQ